MLVCFQFPRLNKRCTIKTPTWTATVTSKCHRHVSTLHIPLLKSPTTSQRQIHKAKTAAALRVRETRSHRNTRRHKPIGRLKGLQLIWLRVICFRISECKGESYMDGYVNDCIMFMRKFMYMSVVSNRGWHDSLFWANQARSLCYAQ